eukprot:GHRR01031895.1.p1 GENE.GHRR01031895.1~~GHRR01031895.1.p1  ORF type:complete len:331 (+),score=133.45 GHRR01031895.1:946-1938(+)
MSTSGLIRSSTASTPCVVSLLDRGGEIAASVADVAAAKQLTPTVLQQYKQQIKQAGLLVLDANFSPDTLAAAAHLAATAGVPVLYEPVSVPKSVRCVAILDAVTYITPNANELLAIAQAVSDQQGRQDLQLPQIAEQHNAQQTLMTLTPAAAAVLQRGLKYIILTLGAQGAALLSLQKASQQQPAKQAANCCSCSRSDSANTSNSYTPSSSESNVGTNTKCRCGQRTVACGQQSRLHLLAHHIPAAAVPAVVNLSGAGDTLNGALAAALLRGASLQQALAVGVAAAGLSVRSRLNVPQPHEGLVYDSVWKQGQQLLTQMQTWQLPVTSAL